MATANYFTKTGTLMAQVTDSAAVVGRPCDYIGNERIVMASNSSTLRLGRMNPKFLEFDRTVNLTGTGANCICYAVCMQRDLNSSADPVNASTTKAHILTRTTS